MTVRDNGGQQCSALEKPVRRSPPRRTAVAGRYPTAQQRAEHCLLRHLAACLQRRAHYRQQSEPTVAWQAQHVSVVLSLGPITSAAAIIIKTTMHSTPLALGVAAIVGVTMLFAILILARTENCKELAEAYERKRLAKRATSTLLFGYFSSKETKAVREAARRYQSNCNGPTDKEERSSELNSEIAPTDHPPRPTNGIRRQRKPTTIGNAERKQIG